MKAIQCFGLMTLIFFGRLVCVFAGPVDNSVGYSEIQVEGITSATVDGLWGRTDYWWRHGDYPRIIALDRLITEVDPNFLEPYSNGGWLMESLGDKSDAEKYYKLGAERNPRKSYLWFSLGFFYFNTMKDYPNAIKIFKLAATAPDGGEKSWKMLAHSYEHNNQLNEAVKIWQKLHDESPNDDVISHNLDKDQKLLLAPTSPAGQPPI